jgi:hypothetical protein
LEKRSWTELEARHRYQLGDSSYAFIMEEQLRRVRWIPMGRESRGEIRVEPDGTRVTRDDSNWKKRGDETDSVRITVEPDGTRVTRG